MFRDAPPSRDDVTTAFTCAEFVEVKTLTSSGMIAPASVPQEMIVESFHHSEPSPSAGITSHETKYVSPIDTTDVIHTSRVSGCSKFISSAFLYLDLAIASLM